MESVSFLGVHKCYEGDSSQLIIEPGRGFSPYFLCRSVVTGKIDENGQSFMMDSKVHLGSDRRFLLLATRVSRLHTQRLGIWVERCYHAPSARRDVGAGGW